MSICAPTLLLISTGPPSATRYRRCSMTAISGWRVAGLGKVAPPTLSPSAPPPPPPVFPPSCTVCFICLTDFIGNQNGCRAMIAVSFSWPHGLSGTFFLPTSQAVNMISITPPHPPNSSSPNHGKPWGLLSQSRKLCSVGDVLHPAENNSASACQLISVHSVSLLLCVLSSQRSFRQ